MKTKIKLAVTLLFLCTGAFVFTRTGQMQTSKTPTETAGQKFKNIKVLNDMPAEQLGKVMNIMSASLNVRCDFCHVGEDFAKDGKEEKETAREMIKMNFDLNKNYFNGRPEISCNTCHQGHAHPQSAINLYPVGVSGHDERPKQPDTKPTIEQILAKYETALGGKANAEKVTSRQITAQRVEPDGKTVETEEVLQKGTKYSAQTTYVSKEKGNYVVKEVFDGTTAQKFGNGETIQLKADELEQIEREGQLFGNPNLKAVYTKMDFRFVDKIDEREVYVVTASTADNVRERLYFDVQSGLLVRRIAATPTVLGAFNYQVDYTDYKDFGGVKLPTTVKFAVPGIRWTRKVLDVKNNVTIDDTKFVK